MSLIAVPITNGSGTLTWTGVITTAGTAAAEEILNNGTQLARVSGQGLPVDVNGGTVTVSNFPATQAVLAPAAAPTAATAASIVNGGTAVHAFVGPINGGYIANAALAIDQGIGTAEVLYVDPVAAPGSTPGSGNGTTSPVYPGGVWTLPVPIPAGVTVYANAATTGHKFTAVKW